MVSGASFGSVLDKRHQMEITTVDLATSGLNLTSALKPNFADSVLKTTIKDAIKRKLTARVSPMTRQTEQVYDPKFCSQVSSREISHRRKDNFVKQEHNMTACSSRNQSGHKRLAEKRKSSATNVMIPKKSVSSNSLNKIKEEPASKRPRTILPRTNTSQEAPRTPLSPEPKLMSDNVATMSLLSASECHLAALQDEDGDTPLHIAIAHGNSQLIEYLVDLMSCLTLDIYNNLKQTPLHLAVITGQAHIVRKMMTAGANANMPDRNGQTPAHLACQRSSTDCLEELCKLDNGIDLELKNFCGFAPLHEAVLARCTTTLRCLVEHGANVNCKDGKSGQTPLHHAVQAENIEIIDELLKCGANPSEPAFSGNTPLQIASGRCMQNIRGLLESNTPKAILGKFKEIPHKQAPQMIVPNYEDRRHVVLKSTYA